MYTKLLELKNQRKTLLEQGSTLIKEGKFEEQKALMEGDVAKLNAQIDQVEKQLEEENRYAQGKGLTPPPAAPDREKELRADEIRASKEYSRAFRKAMKNGVTVRSGVGIEEYAPLYKALSTGGGTPAGADGGFLIPVDFDNAIIRLAKEYFSLADYFNVETVSALSGWRVVEAGTPKALPQLTELSTIGKDDQPKFSKVEYAVKKYGDRLVISNELLEDESADLWGYIAQWFAPKYVLTQNSLLLPMLKGLTTSVELTAGKEDNILKKAIITKLNTAHNKAASILTNQTCFAEMMGWEDKNGRGLLVPDATAADVLRYHGKPIAYGDDTELAERELYIGNFRALGTLFVRKGFEMASTNVGGDAWATDSTEIRVITRLDAQKVDAGAAFKATVPAGE